NSGRSASSRHTSSAVPWTTSLGTWLVRSTSKLDVVTPGATRIIRSTPGAEAASRAAIHAPNENPATQRRACGARASSHASAARASSHAHGTEALAQAGGQIGVERGEIESGAVAQREQASRVEHPRLEAEWRAIAEVRDVGGDARRKRLELVVPLRHQPQLVEAGEHADRAHRVELARGEQDHA